MTDHEALEALSKKVAQTGPIMASALIDLIGGDRRETQRLVRAAIDRGVLTVGPSLKVECRTGQLIPAPSVDDAMVERVARSLAPFMEGGREYDQMPATRRELKIWSRNGMALINDATQDDAQEAAIAAMSAMGAKP